MAGDSWADPERLPRQRRGVTPQMVGRYPDFDVLDPSIAGSWDEATRRAVLARVTPSRELRFFSQEEVPTLRAFTDCLMAQHAEPRVPVMEMLDTKYAEGKLEGYQYEDVPDDRELWHEVLRGLEFSAHSRYRRSFAELEREAQYALCRDLQRGVLQGGPWERFNVKRAFSVVMQAVVTEFYSHPWAWNEMGFGGPAYPRGFSRFGALDPVEAFEERDRVGTDVQRELEEGERP